MTESKWTPGLCVLRGVNDPPSQGNLTLDIGDICGAATLHTHCEEHWPRETQVANGRLLAAAYNSYNRHCRPRAVECAKGDLLGKLLEACQQLVNVLDWLSIVDPLISDAHAACKKARTAIARATGEKS